MTSWRAPLVAAALGLATACAAAAPKSPSVVWPSASAVDIDHRFDDLVAKSQLSGATMIVVDKSGTVYSRSSGNIAPDTPVAIASATKWLSAAAIMTLVDQDRLSLDTELGFVLPSAPAPLRSATLRQLLSHTSGMGGTAIETVDDVRSMDDAVAKLLALTPSGRPGEFFAYGGASMQLAGAMAERTASETWPAFFDARIAKPLGIRTARWGWLRRNGAPDVPLVAGGLTLSGADYAKFLAALLRGGTAADGTRVLSSSAIAAIETDQMRGVPVRFAPQSTRPGWRYGLGVWCERPNSAGACAITSSAGAFGTFPWIDRRRGIAGIFITRAALPKVLPGILELRDAVSRVRDH